MFPVIGPEFFSAFVPKSVKVKMSFVRCGCRDVRKTKMSWPLKKSRILLARERNPAFIGSGFKGHIRSEILSMTTYLLSSLSVFPNAQWSEGDPRPKQETTSFTVGVPSSIFSEHFAVRASSRSCTTVEARVRSPDLPKPTSSYCRQEDPSPSGRGIMWSIVKKSPTKQGIAKIWLKSVLL